MDEKKRQRSQFAKIKLSDNDKSFNTVYIMKNTTLSLDPGSMRIILYTYNNCIVPGAKRS